MQKGLIESAIGIVPLTDSSPVRNLASPSWREDVFLLCFHSLEEMKDKE